ncbi:MAG: AAA family ATPase [Dehalococcoidia bacterium]|nr:AAA family ATPase [Dehalococcoidia bacterium]
MRHLLPKLNDSELFDATDGGLVGYCHLLTAFALQLRAMADEILGEAERLLTRIRLLRAFTPAAPITERELFSGRSRQIDQTMGAVAQVGQHVVLFGERGVGKTSLASVIYDVWSHLQREDAGVFAPRVNCDSDDTFGTLWEKVAEEIELAFEKEGLTPGPPAFREALTELRNRTATPNSIRRCFELSRRSLVVIVDEFDRIEDEAVPRLMADTIKTLSDYLVDATLILVGVADTVDELVYEHGSIDRALVQVLMPRMSIAELQDIVRTRLDRVSMTIDSEVLHRLAHVSQGLPHYTHLLGLHSGVAAIDAGRMHVRIDELNVALHLALEQAQESIRDAYQRATDSPQGANLYRQVLLACAVAEVDEVGYFPPSGVREPFSQIMGRRYDIPNFIRHLHSLCEEDRGRILEREGTPRRHRFRFANPLIKPYVLLRGLRDGLVQEKMIFPED